MSDTVETLVLDPLEWIGPNARPYTEVLEAWRTSCPRLPIWEEANDRRFVASRHEAGRGRLISVSPAGWEHLREQRPSSQFPGTSSGSRAGVPARNDPPAIVGSNC